MPDLPLIRQRIVVDDSETEKVERRFAGIAGSVGKAVAAGAAAAAAGVAAVVVAGVKGAADVDRGLREVNTLFGITGQAAEDSFTQLRSGVAGLSDEVGIAQDVLVKGLYQAISSGVPRDNAFEFLRVASQASIAGVTDVETAVDGLTTTLNAFGLDASQAQAVADSMFAAVKGGKTNFEQLSASLFNIAPAAAAAGVSFQEVNAAIATLTASGTPTSVATTQLRAALTGLQAPSKDLDKIFNKLGFTNAQAAIEAKGLGFALDAVKDASGGSNGKLQQLLGSSEAVAAAQVLAGTGAKKFAAEMQNQATSAGAATTAFEEMEKSTGRQFERLKTQLHNVSIAIGARLLPVLNAVLAWASTALPPAIEAATGAIRGFLAAIGPVASAVGDLVGAIVAHWDSIRTAAIVVGAIVAAVFGPGWAATMAAKAAAAVATKATLLAVWTLERAEAIKTAAIHSAQVARQVAAWVLLGAQALIHAAKMAAAWLIAIGPIGLVVAAVVALVVAIVKNWDTIWKTTVAVFNAVKDFLAQWWPVLLAVFTGGLSLIVALIIRNWEQIKATTSAAFEAVKAFVGRAIDSVVEFVKALPGRIMAGLAALGGMLTSAASTAWNAYYTAVRTVADAVIGFVAGLPGAIVRAIGNLGGLLYEAGRSLIDGLLRGIRAMAGRIADAVLGPIRGAVGGARRFLRIGSPSKLMRELGRETGQGYVLGLGDTNGMVGAAAHTMAVSAVQGVTGAGGGGRSVTIAPGAIIIDARGADPASAARIEASVGAAFEELHRELIAAGG